MFEAPVVRRDHVSDVDLANNPEVKAHELKLRTLVNVLDFRLMTPTGKATTLLFVHGASFTKEIWQPIQRRLKELPLFKSTPNVQFASIDLPYHGTKQDESVRPIIDEAKADVDHPAGAWVSWSSNAVHDEVKRLQKQKQKGAIIGIGHSMGAAALWTVEVENPGTFNGLVLFEPIVEKPGTRDLTAQRFMLATTLKRQHRWESREAAADYFKVWKGSASWDRESLDCWLETAIVSERDGSDAVVLACHPAIEAAIYCRDRLWLTEDELKQVQCPVTFNSSTGTRVYDRGYFAGLEQKHPRIYSNTPPLGNTGHNMVMEDPAACAIAIYAGLAKFDCFKTTESRL